MFIPGGEVAGSRHVSASSRPGRCSNPSGLGRYGGAVTNRWVAFLRSINVGGRRVTNDALAQCVTAAGYANVATFLASGNLIFDAEDTTEAALSVELASVLEAGLGFAVPAFVRSAADVHALADASPFTEQQLATTEGKPQVTLLVDEPSAATWKAVKKLSTPADILVPGDRAWFWLPHEGVSLSKLNMREVEGLVGVGTTRTRNTVARIAKKFLS